MNWMANARNRIKRTRLSQPDDEAKHRRSKSTKSGNNRTSSPPLTTEVKVGVNTLRMDHQADFSTSSEKASTGGGGSSSKIDVRHNPRRSLLPKKGRSSDVAMLYRPSAKNIANVKRSIDQKKNQSSTHGSVSDRVRQTTSTHFVPISLVPSLNSHRQSDLVDQIEWSPQDSPKTDQRKRKADSEGQLKLNTKTRASVQSVRNVNDVHYQAAEKGSSSDKGDGGDIALEDLKDDYHDLDEATVHVLFFNNGVQVNYDGSIFAFPTLADGPVQNTPQQNTATPSTSTNTDLVSQLFGGKLGHVR
jgi:hypothetical protein